MILIHIITKKRLIQFWDKYSDAEKSLKAWYRATQFSNWNNFADLRRTFRSADQVKNFTVFNVGGNKFRLIAYIDYKSKKVFIRDILLHKDYDKNKWKEDSWFE